jgi:hypothetical protein
MILNKTENEIFFSEALNEIQPNFENINNILYKNEKKIYKVDGWRFYVHDNDLVNIPLITNKWFPHEFNLSNISIDLKFNYIPKNIQTKYIEIINKFNINDKIIANVNSFINKFLPENFLGVHIRTWYNNNTFQDNRASNERYNHFLSVRNDFIDNINKSDYNLVLICTDNKEEIKYICDNIINKKVIFYTEDLSCNYIQNDFSELLLLSKSSYLIGSFKSTFSELAWWYSNCSIKVNII